MLIDLYGEECVNLKGMDLIDINVIILFKENLDVWFVEYCIDLNDVFEGFLVVKNLVNYKEVIGYVKFYFFEEMIVLLENVEKVFELWL